MLYDYLRSFWIRFMVFIFIKVTAFYVMSLNCTCIFEKGPRKYLNLARYTNFFLLSSGRRPIHVFNWTFSIAYQNFVFRIILNSDSHWVTVIHQRVIPKLFYGMEVRDTYETVHALSICVNLILNDSDKRLSLNKKLNLLIWSSTKKSKSKSSDPWRSYKGIVTWILWWSYQIAG